MTPPDRTGLGPGVDTVVLHIGTMKTGTTYLQSRFKQHRRELARAGVCYPRRQLPALRDLFGRRGTLANREVRGAWQGLLDELRTTDARTGVVSMEYLSTATPDRIASVVADLAPATVEVVITARDLVRVAVAQWQETIQNRSVWTWSDFAASITAEPPDEGEPGIRFWRQHDVGRLVDDWSSVVGPEHVHLVTVPPAGSPPDVLWSRFCAVVGVDPGAYVAAEQLRANVGVDAASAELLRRINAAIGRDVSHATYLQHVKHLLGKQVLASGSRRAKPTMTPLQHAWAVRHAERLVERLGDRGIHVVGDLRDLVPPPPLPDAPAVTIDDADVAAAAVDVVVALLQRLEALGGKEGADGSVDGPVEDPIEPAGSDAGTGRRLSGGRRPLDEADRRRRQERRRRRREQGSA